MDADLLLTPSTGNSEKICPTSNVARKDFWNVAGCLIGFSSDAPTLLPENINNILIYFDV